MVLLAVGILLVLFVGAALAEAIGGAILTWLTERLQKLENWAFRRSVDGRYSKCQIATQVALRTTVVLALGGLLIIVYRYLTFHQMIDWPRA